MLYTENVSGGAFNLSDLLAVISAREFNRSLLHTNVSQVLDGLDNLTLFVPTDAAMQQWTARLLNTVCKTPNTNRYAR